MFHSLNSSLCLIPTWRNHEKGYRAGGEISHMHNRYHLLPCHLLTLLMNSPKWCSQGLLVTWVSIMWPGLRLMGFQSLHVTRKKARPPQSLTSHEFCFVPLPPSQFLYLLISAAYVHVCLWVEVPVPPIPHGLFSPSVWDRVSRLWRDTTTATTLMKHSLIGRGWPTVQRFRDLSSRQEARQSASRRGVRVSQGVCIWIQRQQQGRRCH